jgi:alpha-glucosidase
MPWNSEANAGFSTADEAALWLPICAEHETMSVEAQLADPSSSLNLYRALLSLRKAGDALRRGSYAEHPAGDAHCLAYVREAGEERMLVALNLSSESRRVALGVEAGRIVISTGLDREGEAVAGELTLAPDEGVVIVVDEP